ncbi:acetyl-CoA carboxylase beta subunit [Salmonella bongori]|nr:acetyl-CoA carboxylase beta subunit [Salmonella bongori]
MNELKATLLPPRKASIPEGVWTKCDSCGQVLYRAELERNLEVCPKCDHHMRMSARNRLHSLLDEGSLVELGSELEPKDVLKFRDSKKYKDRLASRTERNRRERRAGGHERNASTVCRLSPPRLNSRSWADRWALSLAHVLSVPVEQALEDNCPLSVFFRFRGARMQEAADVADADGENVGGAGKNAGAWSALYFGVDRSDHGRCFRQFCDAGRSQISRNPKALIGFAGPRVIEQTVREKLRRDSSVVSF